LVTNWLPHALGASIFRSSTDKANAPTSAGRESSQINDRGKRALTSMLTGIVTGSL
jgi:hypothetical protein